ncbi:HD domain-containing protein [Muriicola sp. E247]|uniref:HD domain-containing protein n=1 Tax=Muriicola sp. E247 TaxID=3242730 RepID=UPI0035243D73
MTRYLKLRKKALHMLRTELSGDLCYHGMAHTLDVLKVCNGYIRRGKLYGEKAMLLRTGALCHDLGFTVSYENHEEHGIIIALRLMKEYYFTPAQRKVVVGLIRATEVPQTPKTNLERILCDADLDYLGRDDYSRISNLLLKELKRFGVNLTAKEWRQKQISFLEEHRYHTPYAQKYREPVKQNHLLEIKDQLSA